MRERKAIELRALLRSYSKSTRHSKCTTEGHVRMLFGASSEHLVFVKLSSFLVGR